MRILDGYAPALVAVTIALGSSSASAISVVLLTQDRSISASASGCERVSPDSPDYQCGSDSDSDAAVAFDLFDSTVSASFSAGSSLASQLSTVTSSLVSGSVHTTASGEQQSFGSPEGGAGNADSVFRISFSATEATPYAIQGSLFTGNTASNPESPFGGTGYASIALFLRDSVGPALFVVTGNTETGDGGLREFANNGVLAPGDYLLEAFAQSRAAPERPLSQVSGTADFNFVFSIVPEPSTAASLALGLALLGLRNGTGRERRRREAGPARPSERMGATTR